MRAIGRDPLFVERGDGRRDHRRRRQPLRRLGLLVGPADPRPRPPARSSPRSPRPRRSGHDVRRADRRRGRPRRGGRAARAGRRDAAHDVVGHRGVDERDPPRARRDRPREAAEVRRRLPRPRRRPARRGRQRPGDAGDPRRARASRRRRPRAPIVVPWNDPDAVVAATAEHEFAAILAEPYPANMGLVPPAEGFLELLRERATAHRRAARLRRGHHRLPRRARRGAGADRRHARPHDPGQDHRRRAAGRGLRRLARADGAASRRPATSTRRARCRATRSPSPPALRDAAPCSTSSAYLRLAATTEALADGPARGRRRPCPVQVSSRDRAC